MSVTPREQVAREKGQVSFGASFDIEGSGSVHSGPDFGVPSQSQSICQVSEYTVSHQTNNWEVETESRDFTKGSALLLKSKACIRPIAGYCTCYLQEKRLRSRGGLYACRVVLNSNSVMWSHSWHLSSIWL